MPSLSDRSAWLKGPSAPCQCVAEPPGRVWHLILLGAPGVGKGTQAELLSRHLGACHLSTGDVFRAAKALPPEERSPAMADALGHMQRGELVPDATVLDMVRERAGCLRCQGGFLLDGFPRTVPQAEALQALLAQQGQQLDAVLSYEMPIQDIVERLSGRRTCSGCKAVYHVTARPPRVADTCDRCGGALLLREDDRPAAVQIRMQAYADSTAPLMDFYHHLGLLQTVVAGGTPEAVLDQGLKVLGV